MCILSINDKREKRKKSTRERATEIKKEPFKLRDLMQPRSHTLVKIGQLALEIVLFESKDNDEGDDARDSGFTLS